MTLDELRRRLSIVEPLESSPEPGEAAAAKVQADKLRAKIREKMNPGSVPGPEFPSAAREVNAHHVRASEMSSWVVKPPSLVDQVLDTTHRTIPNMPALRLVRELSDEIAGGNLSTEERWIQFRGRCQALLMAGMNNPRGMFFTSQSGQLWTVMQVTEDTVIIALTGSSRPGHSRGSELVFAWKDGQCEIVATSQPMDYVAFV